MEIRKVTIDDVKYISRIHALSWKAAYRKIVPQAYLDELKEEFWIPAFTGWIKDNALAVQLIYDNGSPVGCIAYGKSRDEALPDWGEIVSLYLLPEYFGKGCGSISIARAHALVVIFQLPAWFCSSQRRAYRPF